MEGESAAPEGSAYNSHQYKKSNKMTVLGGPMNSEEMRMNKDLLREISHMKKAQSGSKRASPEISSNTSPVQSNLLNSKKNLL